MPDGRRQPMLLDSRTRTPTVIWVESIRKFPNQARLLEMVRAAGFRRVSRCNLTGGIAPIHSGWRI
jgi:ubiquinone/menaquinone biosynthesis C-methylase UbiE